MRKRILKNIDWGIFICALLLCVIGTIALFSATHDNGYDSLQKQLIWIGLSLPIVFILIFVDYDILAKVSPIFYRNNNTTFNRCIIYNSS